MKVKVVLGLSTCNNARILINGDHYVTCMTDNEHFKSPKSIELITICSIRISDLRTELSGPISVNKKSKILIARDALDRSLTMLGANVEEVANDPSIPDTQREEIVHSAGMKIKKQGRPGKHVFSAKNTNVSGKVRLTAEGGANSHEWQYTTDVKTFTGLISIPSGTTAKTEVRNLTKGTEYAFFHKPVKPGGIHDWEGPIFLVVT